MTAKRACRGRHVTAFVLGSAMGFSDVPAGTASGNLLVSAFVPRKCSIESTEAGATLTCTRATDVDISVAPAAAIERTSASERLILVTVSF